MILRLFLTLMLALSPLSLLGCNSGSISGVITHDGKGVGGIIVELSGDAQKTTTTSSDGRYSFGLLKPGTYTVTPSNKLGDLSPESIDVILDEDTLNVTGVDFDISIENPSSGCEERIWNGNFIAVSILGVKLLSGYTTVTGNLTITNTTWFNLRGLECLEHVGGNLTISGNALTNLDGLDNLTTVGGSLTIVGNALADLSGIDNLQSVGGHVTISATTLLSLNGLENLETIGGNLTLSANGLLLDIKALSNLASVQDIYFVANPVTLSLEGLNGVTSAGNVAITANPSITSLKGLESLQTVTGFLTISENKKLSSLELDALESVGYDFTVKNNVNLCTSLAEQLANDISVGGETIITGNQVCP